MVDVNEDKTLEEEEVSEGDKPVTGVKAWFFKDGQFSKTAAFATLGNFAVLFTWFFQIWFGGVAIDTDKIHYVVPKFDPESAMVIMGFLNGAYLGNNMIKKRQ